MHLNIFVFYSRFHLSFVFVDCCCAGCAYNQCSVCFCTRRLFVSVGLTANAKELRETARLTEDDNEDDDEDHVADGVNGICSS